jgi:hypothetical protein
MKTTLINRIYRAIQARKQSESKNNEWFSKWSNYLESLNKYLPSGSGIDSGSKIDTENSTENKIIITFEYHHMNENGYYDGWTSHKLILKPTFDSFDMKITGKDRNQIKDYLYDTFRCSLDEVREIENII